MEINQDKEQKSHQIWQKKKLNESNQTVSDDGTQTYFWRAHTVTILVVMMVVLVYESLYEKQVQDQNYNIKRYCLL
jgi:phosphatidylserine synthase 2